MNCLNKNVSNCNEGDTKMKNLQKYYSEFMNKSHINANCYWFQVIEENEYCDNRFCAECGKKFLRWLNEEYKEVELTDDEKIILKNMGEEYKYITRDKDGNLYIFRNNKPKWSDILHAWRPRNDNECISFSEYNHLFTFVQWTDKEPYKIKELLRNSSGNSW